LAEINPDDEKLYEFIQLLLKADLARIKAQPEKIYTRDLQNMKYFNINEYKSEHR
jgi:hypothetical protein